MGDVIKGPRINYGEVSKNKIGDIKYNYFPELAAYFLEIDTYETAVWSLLFLSLGFDEDDEITITDNILMQSWSNVNTIEGEFISQKRGPFSINFMDFKDFHGMRGIEPELERQFEVIFKEETEQLKIKCVDRYIYLNLFKYMGKAPIQMASSKVIEEKSDYSAKSISIIYKPDVISFNLSSKGKLLTMKIQVGESDREKSPIPTGVRLSNEQEIFQRLEELDIDDSIENIFIELTTLLDRSHLVTEEFVLEKLQHFPPYSGTPDVTDKIVLRSGEWEEFVRTDDKEKVTLYPDGSCDVREKQVYENGYNSATERAIPQNKQLVRTRAIIENIMK